MLVRVAAMAQKNNTTTRIIITIPNAATNKNHCRELSLIDHHSSLKLVCVQQKYNNKYFDDDDDDDNDNEAQINVMLRNQCRPLV